ncbi:hypothetical protein CR513_30680, partial [Mucuna pruriens]
MSKTREKNGRLTTKDHTRSCSPLMELQKIDCTYKRKEICGIRQYSKETLHEYWKRFNKLCVTCPHHQISE